MFHGRAKKVVPNSLELVDFAIRLVMFVLNGNSNSGMSLRFQVAG